MAVLPSDWKKSEIHMVDLVDQDKPKSDWSIPQKMFENDWLIEQKVCAKFKQFRCWGPGWAIFSPSGLVRLLENQKSHIHGTCPSAMTLSYRQKSLFFLLEMTPGEAV